MDLLKVVPHLLDRLGVGDRGAAMEVAIFDEPFENVGKRQEGEGDLVISQRQDRAARQHVGDEVAVRQHRSLGLPRRPRGVDQGGEIVGLPAQRASIERFRIRCARLPPIFENRLEAFDLERVRVVEADDRLQHGAVRLGIQDLGQLFDVRCERDRRPAVFEQVLDLVRHHGREDGDEHRPGTLAGEIHDGPLGAVFREKRHAPP